MHVTTSPAERAVATAVAEYQDRGSTGALVDQLQAIARSCSADELIPIAERHRDLPEVAGPLYEYIVRAQPHNARALVALANAYWLTGRGPDVVGEIASRALAADPTNRAAWHLWALTESDPRARMGRWHQVSTRFPEDQLAKANLADNAASVASAEDDPAALHLAISTFEALLAQADRPEQRAAVENALRVLRK